jgi:ABC-type arginine/histidine transport system permease subunit
VLIIVLIVLIFGPRAKWVKRFLPNTANRVVFMVIISALIVGWFVMGIINVVEGDRGEGYFSVVLALLCAGALYRFISEWWLKGAQKPMDVADGRK